MRPKMTRELMARLVKRDNPEIDAFHHYRDNETNVFAIIFKRGEIREFEIVEN